MIAIIGWLATIATALFAFYSILTPSGKTYVSQLVTNFIQSVITTAKPILAATAAELEPIISAFVAAWNTYSGPIAEDVRAPVAAAVKSAFSVTERGLTTIGLSTPDNAVTAASDALADAFGAGISSAVVTAAFEAVFPEKLNTLNGAGPMLAKLAGFDEVAAAVRDPLYEAAFGKSLRYHYDSIFKPEFASEEDAVRWHARRLLSDADLSEVFGVSGLKAKYETPFIASAYNPVSPRALATAFVDVNFPTAQVQAMMQFAGNRDADIAVMLEAFAERSTQNVRNQYLAALLTASEQGVMSEADLDSALTNLNFSDDAKGFVQLTVATKKLQQLDTLYRKSISEAYGDGLIGDADYVPHLEAVGIAQADAEAHYAVDSIKKQGKALLATERAAAQAQAKLERAGINSATAEYRAGILDEAGLALALASAGLSAPLIGYAVSIQSARRQGSLRLVNGQLLSPAAAEVLRGQVAAIAEQVYKKLLDPVNAVGQLAALGVPGPNREAIVAKAAALAGLPILPA